MEAAVHVLKRQKRFQHFRVVGAEKAHVVDHAPLHRAALQPRAHPRLHNGLACRVCVCVVGLPHVAEQARHRAEGDKRVELVRREQGLREVVQVLKAFHFHPVASVPLLACHVLKERVLQHHRHVPHPLQHPKAFRFSSAVAAVAELEQLLALPLLPHVQTRHLKRPGAVLCPERFRSVALPPARDATPPRANHFRRSLLQQPLGQLQTKPT
mmetsp:Transcript_21863/g.36946  ORF Transcript_21863/g.36946 Transcript_21863/m.36946 type:complete len:212 (+) Transcript_21863:725-1360(+)